MKESRKMKESFRNLLAVKWVISLMIVMVLLSCSQVSKEFKSEIVSSEIVRKALKIEKSHPLGYLEAAGEYYRDGKINEAAFMFYLGQLRYRYYIAVNTDEQGGENAVFATLQNVLGSEINYKLCEDVDNYLAILNEVIKWGETYDSKFCSKEINPAEYEQNLNGLKGLKQYVLENKEEIIQERNITTE